MAEAPGAESTTSVVQQCKRSLQLKMNPFLTCAVKDGPLGLLKMKMEHVKDQKIWEYGTPNVSRKNKVIMMVGETGSGKTTLINTMINFIFGVEWEDEHRIQLIDESSKRSQAQSQMLGVTIYQINHEDGFRIPYSMTIIDTPQFGDTRGINYDEKIMRKMREFFHKCKFTEIDAICFVVPSTLARLSPMQTYIYDNVLSIFGNDIKDNIVFFTTFADVQEPNVLSAIIDLPCARSEDGRPVYFKVNNSVLYANNRPNEDDDEDQVYQVYEQNWRMEMESIETFLLHSLPNLLTKDFSLTKEVLAERNALETTLDGLVQKIEEVMYQQYELKQTERTLHKHKAEIEKNEHWKFEVMELVKTQQDSIVHSTNCQECNSTCHHDCLVCFDPHVHSCEVFHLMETCSVCGHNVSAHSSETSHWKSIVEHKKKSYSDVKAKYEKEENKAMSPEDVFIKLKEESKKAEDEALRLIQEVAEILKSLREIAEPNHKSAEDYIQKLIEGEKEKQTSGFAERIQMLEEAIKRFNDWSQRAGTEPPLPLVGGHASLQSNLERFSSGKDKAGPLTIYRMKMEHVKADRKSKVIMMVGETRSGKTTLINTMINFIFGVEWKDDHRIQLITESRQARCQTSSVTVYHINHKDGFRIPYSITIIDTPGFGDTRGVNDEEKIMRKIREFFHKYKSRKIDAICFVVQSPLSQLSTPQVNVHKHILSILGNDIKDNIVFFTTFADDQKPTVLSAITKADAPCARSKDGLPVYFKVNNCVLYANNSPGEVGKRVYTAYERQWKMGMRSIESFLLQFLPGITSKDLHSIKVMLAQWNALEVSLTGRVQKLVQVMFKLQELEQTQRALHEHQAEIGINELFKFEVSEAVKIKTDSSLHSTNCNVCSSTCHHDCLVFFDTFVYFCEAFNVIGTCRVCGHRSSMHSSETYYWQTIVQPKIKVYLEIKEKYEVGEKKGLTLAYVLTKLNAEIGNVEKEGTTLIREIARTLECLQKVTLRPNATSAEDYLRLFIESEMSEERRGFVERIKMLEGAIERFVRILNI